MGNHHKTITNISNKMTTKTILVCVISIVCMAFISQPSILNSINPLSNLSTKNTLDKKQISVTQYYDQLPLQFELNQGQVHKDVQFLSRGLNYTLFLTNNETVLSLNNQNVSSDADNHVIRMRLEGSHEKFQYQGNQQLPGKVHYITGRDKETWNTDISTYQEVVANNVYPGIDLRYHGDQQQLEYDFVVSPGTNTDIIKLAFDGLSSLEIDDDGNLVLDTGEDQLIHKRPIVYQEINGDKISIQGEYLIVDNYDVHGCTSVAIAQAQGCAQVEQRRSSCRGCARATVGFEIGTYDPSFPLIIDPVLDYSTYLGADLNDRGLSIAVDDSGNSYIAGTTYSISYPTNNPYQASLIGTQDAFVTKLNSSGDTILYSTYLGGSGDESIDDYDDDLDVDVGMDIVVDAQGYLYISGTTNSAQDFPIVNAVQPNYGGGNLDGFVSKLSQDGSNLVFSSYLGGSKKDKVFGITLDSLNDIYVAGRTKSNDFPTVNAIQDTYAGNGDAFISKINSNGSNLIYSTYIGGANSDTAKAIIVDSNNQAVITGATKSSNTFPLLNAIQASFGGKKDSFVTKLSNDGLNYIFSTFLGGAKKDKARSIILDSQNNIIIVGSTNSDLDFPLHNAMQNSFGGDSKDGFITKLSDDGNSMLFSTYYGGEGVDNIRSVAIDDQDNIYIVGNTKSTVNISTIDAIQNQLNGTKRDIMIGKFDPNGNRIYGTYFGGSKLDKGYGIAVNSQGSVYVTGVTKSSNNFPTQNALQPLFGGGNKDAFVLKISEENPNQAPTITSSPVTTAVTGLAYSYDVDATDPDGDTLIYSLSLFPQGMSIDSNTGLINWVPDLAGDFNVSVIVDDSLGGTDTQSFVISVAQSNRPPMILSVPPTDIAVDSSYVYQILASDLDNDPLSYSLTNAPVGMTIDQGTGLINWLPVNLGSFPVNISIDDGQGGVSTQSFTLTVSASATAQPPALDPIGDQTALLGSTLTLQLNASDPDGDLLVYLAEPLPLTENMTLNKETGLFTFTPSLAQVGNHIITFIASDRRFEDSETITITVPIPGGTTRLLGKVLTTGGAPLANVRLEIDGVEAFTDANGDYLLDNLPNAGQVRLLIDGSTVDPLLGTFATVPEMIPLIAGADNQLEPAIVLLPLDAASADPVDPNTTSIITSSTFTTISGAQSEPVTLTIAPGNAIVEATGLPYSGDIHISRIEDPTQGPRPLPDDIDLSVYIAIQPFGVCYNTPAPISFPNLEEFAPGSMLDMFGLDHDTGAFEKVGEGVVSADGKTVDSIGGVVHCNSWHGFVPPPPEPPEPDQEEDNGEPKDEDPCENGACRLYKESGNMGEDHSVPSYFSLGTKRSVHLSYNSLNAKPRPIITSKSVFAPIPAPLYMSTRLAVGGIDQGFELFGATPTTIFGPRRPAIQFDASNFNTGVYPYELTEDCQFPISRRSNSYGGNIIIQNDNMSPFGAGWTLRGLHQLYVNSEGIALITEGNGKARYFTPIDPSNYDSPTGDFSVLTRNGDGSHSRRMKNGTLYNFDVNGLFTTKVDRNGNTTSYQYDNDEKLLKIIDPVGKEFNFNYFAGHIKSISDPLNRITQFVHDNEGNLITIIEPNNDERRFEYEAGSNLMIANIDQRNNRKEYTYDFAGRIKEALLPDSSKLLISPSAVDSLVDPSSGVGMDENNLAPVPTLLADIENQYTDNNGNIDITETDKRSAPIRKTDAIGRVTRHQRDEDSLPIQTIRPNTSVITRTFDTLGNPTLVREEFNGAEYQYQYDPFSLVTSYTNPNNHTTTINRDALGNPEQIINHLGHTTTLEYDSQGLVTRMVSSNGLETVYSYNTLGLPETKTETPPAGSPGTVRVTQYSYDTAGQRTQTIMPDGIVLDMLYDEKGRLTRITDNLNQKIEFTYDPYDNLIQTDTSNSDASLAMMVQRAFDNRNRRIEIRMPHNGTEDSILQRILDGNSNITGLTDPNGNATSNIFDGEDRSTENTHRLNGVTTYEYDTNDRMTKIVAPNSVITNYTYDVLGRRLTESSRDRGTHTYTYDLADNVTTITEGRGIVATMTYDALERLSSKTWPNTIIGKNEDVTYTYDSCAFGLGHFCARSDESGTTRYSYDAYGNLTDSSFTEIEGIIYNMNYVYDDGDNISQMTYPSGRVVNTSRDGVRRVEAIDTTVNGSPQNVISNIQYRADNQMLQCTYGNGLIDSRNYDLQGRLTGQRLNDSLNSTIDQRDYSYDKNGNILNIDTNFEDNAYSYDALDRLISDTIDTNEAITYDYDLNDNRLSKTQGTDFSETYTIPFFQNSNGNSNKLTNVRAVQTGPEILPVIPSRSMIYNDAGRLFQLMEEGILKAEYIYNDSGQRTRKTVYQSDGITVDSITIYHYDQMGYLITETDETGALIKDYIWQEGMIPLAQIDNTQGTEQIVYLYTDHLMTARLATDQNQFISWRWEGEAFGNTPAEELAGLSINLRFPGQYFDTETNLHYNHFRYYDPALGRFITSDPIGIYVGLNTYSYASMNPLAGFDMFGLEDAQSRAEFIQNMRDLDTRKTTEVLDIPGTQNDLLHNDGRAKKALKEGAPIAEKALTRGLDKITGDAKKELKKNLDLKRPDLKKEILGEATKKKPGKDERIRKKQKNSR